MHSFPIPILFTRMVHFSMRNELTLAHHNHPKPIVYYRIHCVWILWCGTFYRFGQKYNIHPSLKYHREYFHNPIHSILWVNISYSTENGAKAHKSDSSVLFVMFHPENHLQQMLNILILEFGETVPLKASSGPMLLPCILAQSLDFSQLFISSLLE